MATLRPEECFKGVEGVGPYKVQSDSDIGPASEVVHVVWV